VKVHSCQKIKTIRHILLAGLLAVACVVGSRAAASSLDDGWQTPPNEARLRAYWWWLNGNVTSNSITHDLEAMQAKGFGGAVLLDANGADQSGNAPVPHGPDFFSPAWRALYKHTLHEASRLGLEISLNIQSGWNLGGPTVTKEDAAKKYVWSDTRIAGGTNLVIQLPEPKAREQFYRDYAVVAYRIKNPVPAKSLKNWPQKALLKSLQPFSAPDTSALFEEIPATAGELDADATAVVDLTKNCTNGRLQWAAPAGDWQVFRFGYTIGDHAYVSTASQNGGGFALDVYSAKAFRNYWNAIVAPLIDDAGPLAGTTLKYFHTDSWEIELANWTPDFPDEFKKRHHYDLWPWLPVLAGRIINSRAESDRFLFDYRQTFGDLAIDDHYRLFRDLAHAHGIGIHPESGGPHAVPIDAQRCLGWDDVPMSEFWAWSWEHRIGDANRFFVKQPASAAHTYGHRITQDEGFTTIGPNWQEKIWDNLKPAFDKALCEGMNRLVWHAFVCSPDETGMPGQQYFAGTHLNPKVTWWEKSAPFFSYIDRCQFLLQQGLFTADVLYYYGDHVPNFSQLKNSDPAKIQPGYDYDVITAEALIERAGVRDGKIVLPDGMSYRVLVLPDRKQMALPVLQKIAQLVNAGATVIGPRPDGAETLENRTGQDAAVRAIAAGLWSGKNLNGRVFSHKSARTVLLEDGVLPDCDIQAVGGDFDFIHRTDGDTEIYFVANRSTNSASAVCTFRVSGKTPELWNAVTGEHQGAAAYAETNGRTMVPLEFGPCASWFVIFRETLAAHPAVASSNAPKLKPVQEITGPWTVHFDPKWGGPESSSFDTLMSWSLRPEPGIQFYSGTATYEKSFKLVESNDPTPKPKFILDLGNVRELAEIKVNGKSCGIVWCPPFRVDISDAVRAGENQLSVEVVNFWPNRIIGDARQPGEKHFTQTNIRALTAKTPLEPAGLLGPVVLYQPEPFAHQ